jgi:hypothetical protein
MNQNDTDTAYVWNSEMMAYDGIITYTDLVEIITFVYNTMSLQQNGTNIFLNHLQHPKPTSKVPKPEVQAILKQKPFPTTHVISPVAPLISLDLTKFNMYAQGHNFLKENITVDPVTTPIKFEDKQFIKELKSITLQMWHNFISEHVHFKLKNNTLDPLETPRAHCSHNRRPSARCLCQNEKRASS